ncbi:MAG: HAD-IA family hydrolase [Pseudomonadota bacterium]
MPIKLTNSIPRKIMRRTLEGWTLAFDLDGTLIDTAPDLIATAQVVLDQCGLDSVPEHILRPEISFGSRRMLERALAHLGEPEAEHDLDAMFEAFIVHYAANIAAHSRPFPGVREVIDRARGDGALIAVCTNKREDLTRILLDALNLTDQFDAIAGRDTYDVHKPNPGHLLSVVADAGGEPEMAVMVGDSDTDVKTAKAADIPVIGVTFGYTSIPVTDLDCNAVIESYDAFDEALEEIIEDAADTLP